MDLVGHRRQPHTLELNNSKKEMIKIIGLEPPPLAVPVSISSEFVTFTFATIVDENESDHQHLNVSFDMLVTNKLICFVINSNGGLDVYA